MNFIKQQRSLVCLAVACVGFGTVYVIWRRKRNQANPVSGPVLNRVCGVDYPEDTVIMHCPNFQAKNVPSVGHFCMKLQTYLNVTKIPYQLCLDPTQGKPPKDKLPWIEYNGMTMGDSQLIIDYLNKEFKVNLNKRLDPYQRATAWAIQKWLEEFTYWLNVQTSWVIFADEFLDSNVLVPLYREPAMKRILKEWVKPMTYHAGVGRHTDEEVFEMMQFDLRQLSNILGNKTYLMGDEITELDCAAFGILSQIRYQTPESCPGRKLLLQSDELKNLRDFIDRIKDQYWTDWDDLLLKE